MSIIHEALKKTERPETKERSARITPVAHKKASAGWRPLLVIALLAIASAPFFAGRILPPSAVANSTKPLGQFAIEEIPVAPMPIQHTTQHIVRGVPYRLSGIVYAGKDSFCLINGIVLNRGDKVGGATVTDITQDTVTLDIAGQSVTLTT